MSWNISVSAKKKREKLFLSVIDYNNAKIFSWMYNARKYFKQHLTTEEEREVDKLCVLIQEIFWSCAIILALFIFSFCVTFEILFRLLQLI